MNVGRVRRECGGDCALAPLIGRVGRPLNLVVRGLRVLRIGAVPGVFFALLWILAWVGASILFRVRYAKPLWPKAPAESRFVERGASGNSLDTVWGRVGGARNCLLVAVTDSELYVTPQFPFNLMFLPEIYGLEDRIPFERIRACTPIDRWYGNSVQVAFSRANGSDGKLSLRLRKRQQFIEALGPSVPRPSNLRWSGP